MEVLNRILGRLVGTEVSGEEHGGGSRDIDEDERQAEKKGGTEPVGTDPGQPTETDPGQSTEAMSVPELIGELPTASGRRKSLVVVELLERADDDPLAFEGHLDGLFDLLGDETTAGNAAMVFDALGAAGPRLLAGHADRLVAALADSPEESAEDLADALRHLTGSAPASDLLDIVAEGPGPARSPATTVLGGVATSDPDAIDVDRLLALARDGDATSRGAALYLGTLLAGVNHGRTVPRELVASDVIELAGAVREGELDQWLRSALSRNALASIVEEVSPAANCDRVEVSKTPRGSHLVIVADRPASVDRGAVREAIDRRLGMEFASINLVETGDDVSAFIEESGRGDGSARGDALESDE